MIQKIKKPRRNFISKGIQYCLVILPLLAVMIFVLQPFYTSRSVIVNILIGGLLCLLIQLYIFSKMYWTQLQDNNFNIIKTIRKQFNRFWGDKPPQFVQFRNHKKYYISTESPDNNLFKPKGDFVYHKVMTQLRGKLTVDYMPKIKDIQTKCQYVEQRTTVIQKIYQFIVKDYSHTAKGLLSVLYNIRKQIPQHSKFLNQHNTIFLTSFTQLVMKIEQNVGLPSNQQSSFQCISWNQTFNMVYLIGNSLHKTEKDINQMCYKLTSAIAADVKSAKNSIIEKLRSLYSNHKKGQSDCMEIMNRIRTFNNKIQEMEGRLEKVKKKQNYEDQLNLQLEIKMSLAEVSSLNVKLWNLKDISTLQSQQLFNQCQKSHSSILNLEDTLQGNAQTLFKTFLEAERQSTYQKIKYIKKIIQQHQIFADESFYRSVKGQNIQFQSEIYDVTKFSHKYKHLCDQKTKQILFYKTFVEDICQVYEKRLTSLETNYQIIERELMRIGGMLTFERLTMKHFFAEIESTRILINSIRQTQKSIRIRTLQFQRNLEQKKRRQAQFMIDAKKKLQTNLNSIQKNQITFRLKDFLVDLDGTKIQENYSQLQFVLPFTQLFINSLQSIEECILAMESPNINSQFKQSEQDKKFRQYYSLLSKIGTEQVTVQNDPQDLNFFNKLISVFLHDWRISEAFHAEIKEKLWLPLNRKRPQILDEMVIKYLKIEEIYEQQITKIRIPKSQIFHCILDFDIMIKGKIGITIQSKIKINRGIPLVIKGTINKAHMSIRLVYTPWAVGKSYFSFLSPPEFDITGEILLSSWNLSKFPLVGLLVKVFLIRIFKTILVWPMRVSMSIPASIRDTRPLAVIQRLKWQHQQQKSSMKWQQHVGNPI